MASVGSLIAIVTAVHADPILTTFTPPGAGAPVAVPGLVGESSKQVKQVAPYVVWIPTKDRFDVVTAQKAAGSVTGFPRLIRTRWMGVEAHIACSPGTGPTDFDQVDVLLNAFVAALHRQTRGSYMLGAGEIKDTKGTELTKAWKTYILNFELAVPITEMPATASTAIINTITDPLSMKFPNGREVPAGGPAFPPP